MTMGVLSRLYARLGSWYPVACLGLVLLTPFPIAAGTVFLLSFYYEAPTADYLRLAAAVLALTAIGVGATMTRIWPRMRPLRRWIGGARGPQRTLVAWRAAVELPSVLVRSAVTTPGAIVIVPSVAAAVVILDVSWLAAPPLLVAGAVALGYSAILQYLVLEAVLRPVLVEVSDRLPPLRRIERTGLPLRVRLFAAIPIINLITGFVVAALTAEDAGTAAVGVEVLIAVGVATTISLGLIVLLSRSVLRPVADLHDATHAVAEARFDDVRVPVTSGDELGELAASFNEMAGGLRERERLREALGTYLDDDVAEYILSEGFSEEGVERDVSVLFCDVRDFTALAAAETPTAVFALLNRLFAVIVPVISAHGGHVDKFEGDGLFAVFGAPEPNVEHADRAVRAACEIARRVNEDREAGELEVGIGINSGPVIAGAVGGGGRLDFSVIGAPVNLASRVETATRTTGDPVLITAETRRRLGGGIEVESRGRIELRGIAEAIELYAPVIPRPGAAPGSRRIGHSGGVSPRPISGSSAKPKRS